MPPRKRGVQSNVDTYDEGDGFVASDDGGSHEEKRLKTAKSKQAALSSVKGSNALTSHQKQLDDDGNPFWEMGGKLRRIKVNKFKGNTFISIREHYEKDGKVLPGKKGISLNIEQFNAMLTVLPQIEAQLKKENLVIIRPDYDKAVEEVEEESEDVAEEESEEVSKSKKKQQEKKRSQKKDKLDDEDE